MPLYPNYVPNSTMNPNTNIYTSTPNYYVNNAQSTHNIGFIWVQGEEAAKAYPVAAGNQVLLMDSDKPVLYMKSTDASGRPQPMEIYDLVRREEPVAEKAVTPDLSEYVRKDEIKELIASSIAELRPKKQNKPKREEEHDA